MHDFQDRVESVSVRLILAGIGVSMTYELFQLLEFFFSKGDNSRLPTYVDTLRSLFENSKHTFATKIAAAHLASLVFERFWARMVVIPTQEMVASLNKMYKNSAEWQTRIACLKALKKLITANPVNAAASYGDIYKLITRGNQEKMNEVRLAAAHCLARFCRAIDPKHLSSYLEGVLSLCNGRGLDDPHEDTRQAFVDALKNVFSCNLRQ